MLVTARDIAARCELNYDAVRQRLLRAGVAHVGWLCEIGTFKLYEWAAVKDLMHREPDSEPLTTREVAFLAQVDVSTISRWRRSGRLEAAGGDAKTGYLYRLDDVLEAKSSGKRTGRPRKWVRYTCPVCERPRTGHFEPDACPPCVWKSLHQPTSVGDGYREDPVYCEEPGCSKTTKYRKPFCKRHIDRMPYVRWLLSGPHDETCT